jgi:hypothetical protein
VFKKGSLILVRSLDLSLSRLSEIGRRGGGRAFQQDDLILGWTPLPAFDSYVVNVFSPVGSALWNFNIYAPLFQAEFEHHSRFLEEGNRARTARELLKVIREAGHAKRSDFSAYLLGNWMATPDYLPSWGPSDAHYLAHRHRSMLVAQDARSSVTEHFVEQTATFLDSSFKPCDDLVDLCDIDSLRCTPEWQLLTSALTQIRSQSELQNLLAKVNELNEGSLFSEFTGALDLRFGIQGCISLWMPPASVVSPLFVGDCAKLLEFRLKVALSVCSLPQIERLMNEVKGSFGDSETPFPIEFRESLWQALRDRLCPYLDLTSFKF